MTPAPANPLGVGLHFDIPAAIYHADPCAVPSLSSGVARVLVDKTPAHAHLDHIRLGGHKSDPTAEMILGSYVHGLMAGDLAEFEIGNYDNYTTKAAKEWRDLTTERGLTPILEKKVDQAHKIMKALHAKAARGVTMSPFEHGKPEVTAVWQEKDDWFRARYDRLILDENGFSDIWDWKTTGVGVSEDDIVRQILEKGYHIQAAHYLRGLSVLCPRFAGRTSFIFVFVETEEPFAVRRVVLSEAFRSLGGALLDRAIREWSHCMKTGLWPDGPDGTVTVSPPTWYAQKMMEQNIE